MTKTILSKEELVEAVENYQMENPSDSRFNIMVMEDGDIELTIEDNVAFVGHRLSKQSFINELVITGVLEEGQVIKSEDE